jgi:hypothetical protein
MYCPATGDSRLLASIAGYRRAAGVPNLLSPLCLDADSERWPVERADALVCINMVHITPWTVSEGLMAGARRTLRAGGILYLYGPFRIDGRHIAQSNEDFDLWLQRQNAEWGIRDVANGTDLATRYDLALVEAVSMPANNMSVIFRLRAQVTGQ